MRKTIAALLLATSMTPAMAQNDPFMPIGEFAKKLSMLKYAREWCDTTPLDQQLVEDVLFRIARKMGHDRSTLQLLADNSFPLELVQKMRQHPQETREYMQYTYCPQLRKMIVMSKEILLDE
jgi:hypothetical protein